MTLVVGSGKGGADGGQDWLWACKDISDIINEITYRYVFMIFDPYCGFDSEYG
jgi:hypothetical protein